MTSEAKTRIAYLGILVFFLLAGYGVVYDLRRVESVEKYGVVVKGIVIGRSHAKSDLECTVRFVYNKIAYKNYFRTDEYEVAVGDSVTCKIAAQDPTGYCEYVTHTVLSESK